MTNEQLFEKIALLLQAYFDTHKVSKEVQASNLEIIEEQEKDVKTYEQEPILEENTNIVVEKQEPVSNLENSKIKNKKKKFLI